MSEKIVISLDDLDLEENTKKEIKDIIQLVTDKVITTLGDVDQTVIMVPETTASIVNEGQKTRKKRSSAKKKEPAPSVKQKIEATGLDKEIKDYINKDLKANIKDYHANDIAKVCMNTNAINLAPKLQKKLVDKCLDNRNFINMRNSEESCILLIKDGSKNLRDVETWHKGLIRVLDLAIERIEVPNQTYTLLNTEQKQDLVESLNNIKIKINKGLLLLKKS